MKRTKQNEKCYCRSYNLIFLCVCFLFLFCVLQMLFVDVCLAVYLVVCLLVCVFVWEGVVNFSFFA